jgi:hypothetical protein
MGTTDAPTTPHPCRLVTTGEARPDPDWPTLAFGGWGTLCGPWVDAERWLEANGYQPGYAGNPGALLGQGSGLAIDRDVAATTPCPACERTGADFQAWANPEGLYGVAVAICACGHATTF